MKIENGCLSVDKMREKRNTAESIFMKFTLYKDLFESYAFCFYEGEDAKYYDSRVRQYWGENFISLVAGKKKEVLKVMKKIRLNPLYSKVIVMFFVDRDFDEVVDSDDPDLFETSCYSVENYYAQDIVLSRILKAEFGLDIGDSDYRKCMDDFRNRFQEFNDIILIFNALLKYQRKHAPLAQCNFNNVNTFDLVQCSIEGVQKAEKCDKIEAELRGNIDPDSEILDSIKKSLESAPNASYVLRGKNQLDFFVSMLREFKKLSASEGYFSKKLPRVYLDITKNRLSELSQYAITPPELKSFLTAHLKQSDG